MATATRGRAAARRSRGIVRPIAASFARHNLLTYAAAIAFQALIALVPLTLLALGLLGATGNRSTWSERVAPAIRPHVTAPVYRAVDYTVRRIVDHGTAGLIAFSALLSLWYLTAAMRAVIEALNQIHDVEDKRSWWRRLAVALGLAAASGIGLFGSALLLLGAPASPLLGVLRWVVAIALIGLVIALVVRFAPAQRPQTTWASVGAVLVVSSWVVASVLFKLWVTHVADFKTPIGSLTALLALTSYLFVSSTVFLVGVQLDELLRKSHPAAGGIVAHAKHLLGR
ncbi:MAG TPA: YihY/virulence factor BrkB family protein [Gaiellaceae bacterium]|nr:YihY/virulence factor BrkB family protein [Gaiellaceae bacterium]